MVSLGYIMAIMAKTFVFTKQWVTSWRWMKNVVVCIHENMYINSLSKTAGAQ